MPRTRPTLTAIALALTIAACGQTNGVETKPTWATLPPTPNCADVFHDGQPVEGLNETAPTCTDPDGMQQQLGAQRCDDGTHLVSVDQHIGAPSDGWYTTADNIYHADPSLEAGSPYGNAYSDCHGEPRRTPS